MLSFVGRTNTLRALALASLVAGVVLPAREANAQAIPASNGEGFDTHLFRPALDSRGFIAVNGVDVVSANHVSFGLVLDWGHGILRVPDVGQSSTRLINNSFTGTFQFNYGLGNRLAVGVSAPVVLMSGGEQPAVTGWGPQALDLQSIQHLALHGKLKILRADDDRSVGLAIGLQVGVPVNDASKSAGADPSFWYWPMIIAEKRFGSENQVRLAANFGFRGHGASSTTLGLRDGQFKDGSLLTYGLGGSIRILEPLDLVAETYGTYLLNGSSASAVRPSNEALGGIKLFVERSSYLVVGAGTRYTTGYEAADIRATIGFIFEPSVGDSDGDGVADDVDRCPNVPGVMSNEGCPLDTDGDGIPDVEDACPYVKGPRTNDPRTNGCPQDRDGDGIPDAVDACPDVPGVATHDPKTNGCPPPVDQDHDGIPDAEDACPTIWGPRHPDPKRNGCPDVYIGPDQVVVFDKILFKVGSAEILPESNPILDKVAKALNDHPELTLVEVAGHADERGGEQMNLTLTQARVDSVMSALIARQVDQKRLRAKGYGFYCPRDPEHNEEAWSKNRRVEFLIVKTSSGPTNVPLGCDVAAQHGVKPAPVP